MTANQYRARIAELGLTQLAAAAVLGVTGRTGQNWAASGPPQAVAMLLHAVKDLAALERLAKKATKR